MPRYSAYGATLESDREIPGLAAAESAPRWAARRVAALPAMQEAQLLGEDPIYGTVAARLWRHRDGHRIEVDDTGAFEIGPEGRIDIAARPDAWEDFVYAHLLGRVLATAIFLEGWLPLHGSAVAARDGALAFLAPKGVGKSSLALALATIGAPLLTDDTVPVEPSVPPRAWPGIHSLRVRDDSLATLGLADSGVQTREGKRALHDRADLPVAATPHPLAAIFLLAPAGDDGGAVATRSALPAPLAAAAVLAHVKIGRMLGTTAVATMLERLAPIVRAVPVYRLSVLRDLTRLEEVAHEILGWYGGPAR